VNVDIHKKKQLFGHVLLWGSMMLPAFESSNSIFRDPGKMADILQLRLVLYPWKNPRFSNPLDHPTTWVYVSLLVGLLISRCPMT